MSVVTLIVIPGPGARTVTLDSDTTVAQLVCQENLHGREIIINGVGVPATSYADHVIPVNAEVFATASVKGNTSKR